MAAPEANGGETAEQRSSIEITLNAKGDPQIRVKVYAGESLEVLDETREHAVAQFNALMAALFPTAASSGGNAA